MIAQAQQGNVAAAKLIFAYVLGQPAKTVDPDHLDSDEWQNFKDTTNMYAEMPRVGMAPEPELPLRMVRFSRPVMSDLCGQQMHDLLRQPPAETDEPLSQEGTVDDNPPSPNGEKGAAEQPRAAPSANGVAQTEPSLTPELWEALLDLAGPSPIGDNGDRRRSGGRMANKRKSPG
jgi:hypothetical protein